MIKWWVPCHGTLFLFMCVWNSNLWGACFLLLSTKAMSGLLLIKYVFVKIDHSIDCVHYFPRLSLVVMYNKAWCGVCYQVSSDYEILVKYINHFVVAEHISILSLQAPNGSLIICFRYIVVLITWSWMAIMYAVVSGKKSSQSFGAFLSTWVCVRSNACSLCKSILFQMFNFSATVLLFLNSCLCASRKSHFVYTGSAFHMM